MRNNKLLVYGSSYDRGLEHLLKMWSKIREEVPEAELHVFYGWVLFDRVYHDNPERQAWKESINELMRQPGITHLGRISHGAVQKEMETAGIWAYPTHFGEISCITAMKAQAFGAIPVVINYAALVETVQHGVKVEGDIYDQETKDEYVKQLTALLKDEKRQEEIRVPMMKWAREKFSWSNVAKQWDTEFRADRPIELQVEELMDDNQALKAWELVKNINTPLKDRVWQKVKHAFDEKEYKKFYSEDLTEHPFDEEYITQAEKIYPRFDWVVPKILNSGAKTVCDLGCADGVLSLTLASHGLKCTGINLFEPSVKLANERAKRLKLDAKFICGDIFDHKLKYDAVVLMEVLEHLPDPKKGIDHAISLLNDGGSLYLSTPRTDHLGVEMHKQEEGRQSWNDGKPSGHLRLFTEEELRDLLKDYEVVDFQIDQERCMLVEVKK